MKRRDFFRSTAAAAASVGLPAAASTATGTPADPFAGTGALIIRLRVGNWRTAELREANRRARGGPAAASPRPAGRQGQLLGGSHQARRQLLLPDRRNGRAGHRVRVPDGHRQPEHVLLLERAEASLPGSAGVRGKAAGVMRALEGGLRVDLEGRSQTQLPTVRRQPDPPGTRATRGNPPRRHADRAETTQQTFGATS